MDNPGRPAILPGMTHATSSAHAGDVLIVGGSLNGATLALALAQAGQPVTVIDAATPDIPAAPDFDGRSYALAHASVRMLGALGLWEALEEAAQPILGIRVCDGRVGEGPSRHVMAFDHAELEEGPMGHMVEDRHLRRTLLEALARQSGVTLLQGQTVRSHRLGAGRIFATLVDGTELGTPVLVGADGRAGGVATRAGITRRITPYSQTALVCAVAHDRPHHGIAHQFFMPAGPLAILPLPGNRASVVWTENAAQAAAVQALDDAAYMDVLRPRFGDFLGAIRLEGARYTYPLARSLARSFTAERVALVGDAARAVHPIAGQGLNAGLRDVAALAEVLVEARRRGEDPGSADVLARYASWRRFDTALLSFATDGFNRLFSNDNPLLRAGRGLGLSLVGNTPMLRRAFMREAAGLTGDLPALLRGKPI